MWTFIYVAVIVGVICACLFAGEGIFDFLYKHIPGFREEWERYIADKCDSSDEGYVQVTVADEFGNKHFETINKKDWRD